MRYRQVPLEEMVALNHSIRLQSDALAVRGVQLTEAMRSVNHRAIGHQRRALRELAHLAAEVEGQALRIYGSEAWDRARRIHWAHCDAAKVSVCEPVDAP